MTAEHEGRALICGTQTSGEPPGITTVQLVFWVAASNRSRFKLLVLPGESLDDRLDFPCVKRMNTRQESRIRHYSPRCTAEICESGSRGQLPHQHREGASTMKEFKVDFGGTNPCTYRAWSIERKSKSSLDAGVLLHGFFATNEAGRVVDWGDHVVISFEWIAAEDREKVATWL